MKVYILVLEIPYEGLTIESVHSTMEKAELARRNHIELPSKSWELKIEEWEIELEENITLTKEQALGILHNLDNVWLDRDKYYEETKSALAVITNQFVK